jgi:metallo-beta-lactamase family protein
MERTQDLLFHLNNLVEKGRVPRVPVFIDSPLAINLTAIYKKYKDYFDEETAAQAFAGDDLFNFPGLRLTLTTEESKAINDVPAPKIIIAGSGMSNGGRILHHERRYLSDPKSTILFVGYQSRGTLGRKILEGARSVRIFGEEVPVRCRVRQISGYSAHADQPRLISWLRPMRLKLKRVFVVQGEPEASEALAQRIRDELALETAIPRAGESYMLE